MGIQAHACDRSCGWGPVVALNVHACPIRHRLREEHVLRVVPLDGPHPHLQTGSLPGQRQREGHRLVPRSMTGVEQVALCNIIRLLQDDTFRQPPESISTKAAPRNCGWRGKRHGQSGHRIAMAQYRDVHLELDRLPLGQLVQPRVVPKRLKQLWRSDGTV